MMNHDNDIFMQQVKQQIHDTTYPKQVDVVDSVMERISSQQLVVKKRHTLRNSFIISAAACALILISVNTFTKTQSNANSEQLGSFVAEMYGASTDDYGYSQATCASAQLAYAFL